MLKRMRKNKKGFTLAELLIVDLDSDLHIAVGEEP